MWGTCRSSSPRSLAASPVPTGAAVTGAIPLLPIARAEGFRTAQALARFCLEPVLSTAMRVESGGAVRADDAQVLDPVVVAHTVNVVEDEADRAPVPVFVLPTELAAPLLEPGRVEPPLQTAPAVCRANHQHLVERDPSTDAAFARGGIGIEVIDRDPELGHPPLQCPPIATRRAIAQPAERFGPRQRSLHRSFKLIVGVPGTRPSAPMIAEVVRRDAPALGPLAHRGDVLAVVRVAEDVECLSPGSSSGNRLIHFIFTDTRYPRHRTYVRMHLGRTGAARCSQRWPTVG